ncbi:unnamed protein product [Caenorhabditis bovis]|uniref:Cyclin-like domain-containing protein n=1 Tax=Caenorhabditis bovis TaxID=2654633 RepID=A0A8S1F9K2_9PELO|nr:unnamed protein product [Caenorhabditis bovis]
MAGRKSTKSRRVSAEAEKSQPKQGRKSAGRNVLKLSTETDIGLELIETANDIKENIPERSKRVTRSSKIASQPDSSSASSSDKRKRRNPGHGPPAKRKSIEKTEPKMRNRVQTSYTVPMLSRTRGAPIIEEDEDDEDSDESPKIEESLDLAPLRIASVDSETFSLMVDDSTDRSSDSDGDELFDKENELDLENSSFAAMRDRLNDVQPIKPPSALLPNKLHGIGSPEKVWSLMVSRDDISRASKCLLNNHPDLSFNMRAVLLDWLMEVCESEYLHRETFHLAVDYVDRFFESSIMTVTQYSFQLVGTAALFVASKYEEIYPPKCRDFANLTDGAFSCDQVRQMEVLITRALDFTLGPITSLQWMSMYLQLLCSNKVGEDEHVCESNYFVPELMREDFIHMAKILDYLLFEEDSLQYTYRTIAAAVLFACYEPRSAVENATGFMFDQLLRVIDYVDPVVVVFDKLRAAGDPLPTNDRISPDDVHNIQSYFKYKDVEKLVGMKLLAMQSVGESTEECPASAVCYNMSTSAYVGLVNVVKAGCSTWRCMLAKDTCIFTTFQAIPVSLCCCSYDRCNVGGNPVYSDNPRQIQGMSDNGGGGGWGNGNQNANNNGWGNNNSPQTNQQQYNYGGQYSARDDQMTRQTVGSQSATPSLSPKQIEEVFKKEIDDRGDEIMLEDDFRKIDKNYKSQTLNKKKEMEKRPIGAAEPPKNSGINNNNNQNTKKDIGKEIQI